MSSSCLTYPYPDYFSKYSENFPFFPCFHLFFLYSSFFFKKVFLPKPTNKTNSLCFSIFNIYWTKVIFSFRHLISQIQNIIEVPNKLVEWDEIRYKSCLPGPPNLGLAKSVFTRFSFKNKKIWWCCEIEPWMLLINFLGSKGALAKVALDQTLFAPSFIVVFITAASTLNGLSYKVTSQYQV